MILHRGDGIARHLGVAAHAPLAVDERHAQAERAAERIGEDVPVGVARQLAGKGTGGAFERLARAIHHPVALLAGGEDEHGRERRDHHEHVRDEQPDSK